jgi:hypothetical protein
MDAAPVRDLKILTSRSFVSWPPGSLDPKQGLKCSTKKALYMPVDQLRLLRFMRGRECSWLVVLGIACAAFFFTSCATTETVATPVPHGMGTYCPGN